MCLLCFLLCFTVLSSQQATCCCNICWYVIIFYYRFIANAMVSLASESQQQQTLVQQQKEQQVMPFQQQPLLYSQQQQHFCISAQFLFRFCCCKFLCVCPKLTVHPTSCWCCHCLWLTFGLAVWFCCCHCHFFHETHVAWCVCLLPLPTIDTNCALLAYFCGNRIHTRGTPCQHCMQVPNGAHSCDVCSGFSHIITNVY